MTDADFVYRLRGKPGSARPGTHGSRSEGQGLAFARHGALLDYPDPRRLDLRASLRSVPREWLVRIQRQRGAVTVQAVIDVSASMHAGKMASQSKLAVVERFLEALGMSAFRGGDRVGMFAFDNQARDDLRVMPRFARAVGHAMAGVVSNANARKARSGGIEGLAQCAAQLRGSAALVFIVSDFHWPLDNLGPVLESMAADRIVPVVLWDELELAPPATNGWMSLVDAESGKRRHIWLNERMRERWLANAQQRRELIDSAFGAKGIRPFHLEGDFRPEAMSSYFRKIV